MEILGISLPLSMTTVYLVIAVIVLLLLYDAWTHTYFWRMGLPGPCPLPIVGNVIDFFQGPYVAIDRYADKYGKVVGAYDWRRPIIIVNDPEILRHIMVKDFTSFCNRRKMPLSSGAFDMAIFNLRDEHWKKVRDVLTPTFTGRKMKLMSSIVNKYADTMTDNLRRCCQENGIVECKELYGGFAMDIVASCAFGLKVDSQQGRDHPFIKNAARFFQEVTSAAPAIIAVSFLPWMRHIFKFFNVMLFPKDVVNFFSDVTEKAIELRKRGQSEKKVDFLQLLLDAQKGDNDSIDEEDDDDVHNKYFADISESGATPTAHKETLKRPKTQLMKEEIYGQAMVFLSAGYETTTTALSMTSYLLATNQEQQDKLIAEIDKMAPSRDDVSYTSVSKMPYLDQVLCESLRIYPPTPLIDRDCNQTFSYGGYTFPKGVQVIIPPYSLHRLPEYWPDPMTFDPDRFSKENREKRHPYAWMPFGAGPRMCLGMRFAMMEAKMALVRALQEVRFDVSPQTEIPPDMGKGILLSPQNGVTLKVVPRH